MTDVVDLESKFELFSEHWSPKLVARLNDDEVKVLLLEPSGVVNTGDAGGDLTATVELI